MGVPGASVVGIANRLRPGRSGVRIRGGRKVFRRVCKIAKSGYQLLHVCVSFCPSAWNNSPPT